MPTFITTNTTIPVDQTIDQDGPGIVVYVDGTASDPSVNLFGAITGSMSTTIAETIIGVRAEGGLFATADFVIEASGEIIISATGTFATAYGFRSSAWAPDIANHGLVEVTSTGSAWGFDTNSSTMDFVNTGDILVTGTDTVFGVRMGSGETFDNSGLIEVHGGNGPTWGVTLSNTADVFTNSGSIIVTDTSSVWFSSAVTTNHFGHLISQVSNSGLLQADYAVREMGNGGDLVTIVTNQDAGVMRGDIDLSLGADSIFNYGLIVGNVYLGAGNDVFTGYGSIEGIVYGGDGNDIISGFTGDNILYGDVGDDFLDGGGGTNVLIGGAGADSLAGVESANNTASYATAATGVTANLSNAAANTGDAQGDSYLNIQSLIGSDFADLLSGDALQNTIRSGAGNDVLDGREGGDTLIGGSGDDSYVIDNAGDIVSELASEGDDIVLASVNYTLTSNVERLTLAGAASINGSGNGDANIIVGNSGANIINGAGGNDTLTGGAGIDQLFGGDGNDVIFFDAADDLANVQGGVGVDTLVFTGAAPTTFNLASHGFEVGEARFVVTGATFSQFYDTQWRLSHEEGEASNGATWYVDWDEANNTPYQRLNQDFDASGQLTHEYGLADNGSTWDLFFDTDGTHPYVSILQVRTAGGVFANEHGISDNGSTWDTFYDVDGTNPFQWVQQVRDAFGVLAQEEGLADSGTSWFTDFDETGTTDYVFYQNVYDTLDRLSFQSGEYDTGYTWTIDYDETNTQPWTSIRNDYDDNGNLIGTTTIWDGP